MRLRTVAFVTVLAVALSPACRNKDRPDEHARTALNAGSILAEGVRPGSHEDWCEEHQVPESQCTKCHPELIPAFKAVDDWDEEHHIPASQCTECTPPRVPVRPPKGG
jgi:hypothetical protein